MPIWLWLIIVLPAVIGSGLLGRIEGYTRGLRENPLAPHKPRRRDLVTVIEYQVTDPDKCRCGHGRHVHTGKNGQDRCSEDRSMICYRFTPKQHRVEKLVPPDRITGDEVTNILDRD